jgi:Fe-S-cluster containining protein
MSSDYTETVVSCATCGKELSDAEIRFLWSDVDFLDHGDHYATPSDEPAYWRVARMLAPSCELLKLEREGS